MASAYLRYVTPDGPQRQQLTDKPVTIGRHRDNLIVLDDDQASRFHCVIEPAKGGFNVRDLKSKNGTFVNDERIDRHRLSGGDIVRIGKKAFHFVSGEPAKDKADAKEKPPAKKSGSQPIPRPGHRAPAKAPAKKAPTSILDAPLEEEDQPSNADALAALEDSSEGAVSLEQAVSSIDELREVSSSVGDEVEVEEQDVQLISSRGDTIHATEPKKNKKGEVSEADAGARVVRLLLLTAMRTRATDVHIEPKPDESQVRLRVDGMMVEAMRLDKKNGLRLVGVVKVLADIDIAQRNIIQEGHFSSRFGNRHVDYRVSFTPAMHGQKLVIRVLDPGNAPTMLNDLHMPDWMLQQVRRSAKQDSGAIIVAGPTGSGKTTSLYAVLRDVDVEKRNVITIEDPVEYELAGVTQLPIDEYKGNTFATLLRSVLRQDPDVILVGEVRDNETATTAMQAAMTGHLVLTTVHAKDTIGTIFRLLDLGIEPYLVAQALNMVIAQRLVRQLCPHCKEAKKPTPSQVNRLGRSVEGVKSVYLPVGCPRCLNTGYAGRRGIYEMLLVNDDLKDVILKSPTVEAIRNAMGMAMFSSLRENGYKLVIDGITSMDEVDRVVGGD